MCPELERDHKTPSLIISLKKKNAQSDIILENLYFLVSPAQICVSTTQIPKE